ncbi:hypothetical protein [Actinospongicola halichondriae]|uniref:hypothetical protein n=1 Tax=Actinospongicola halichondriae TaxID=3236844 RepID=UPI003D3D3D86
MLPTSLRARIAMVVLLGIFLIPVANSSLRGLTHVLTCQARVEASLEIDTTTADETVLLSADTITADDEKGLCGGLDVDLQLASTTTDEAFVVVEISNGTDVDWQGSVELEFSGTAVPVAIGAIDAGETASDTVTLRIEPGRTYEIRGTLLIGP